MWRILGSSLGGVIHRRSGEDDNGGHEYNGVVSVGGGVHEDSVVDAEAPAGPTTSFFGGIVGVSLPSLLLRYPQHQLADQTCLSPSSLESTTPRGYREGIYHIGHVVNSCALRASLPR